MITTDEIVFFLQKNSSFVCRCGMGFWDLDQCYEHGRVFHELLVRVRNFEGARKFERAYDVWEDFDFDG